MAATKTKTAVQKPRRNLTKGKKPAAKKAEASASTEAKPKREKVARTTHGVESAYAGPSQGFNSGKSRTPIRVKEFGTQVDIGLTERARKTLEPIQKKYGKSPFKRNDLDAGILNMAGRRGYVEHVSGNPDHEDAEYKFTGKALGG